MGLVVIVFLVATWVLRSHQQLLAKTPWPMYFAAIDCGQIALRCCMRCMLYGCERSRDQWTEVERVPQTWGLAS